MRLAGWMNLGVTVSAWALLGACASGGGGAAAPQTSPSKTAMPPTSARLCNESTLGLFFSKIGVPESERPIDLALTPDHFWVLFAPARLARVERHSLRPEIRFLVGDAGDRWTALSVDPVDSSLWIATHPYGLRRVNPSMQVEDVALPQIRGSGSFRQLAVQPDGIYAVPMLAEHGVWRFDRTGKLLSDAFPAEASEGGEAVARDASNLANSPRLEQDAQGNLLAWRWERGRPQVYRADEQGRFSPSQVELLSQLPTPGSLAGLGVGSSEEQWYFPSEIKNLFFWQDQAILLGGATIPAGRMARRTILLVEGPGGVRPELENCAGAGPSGLLAVRADAEGYAGITELALIMSCDATMLRQRQGGS